MPPEWVVRDVPSDYGIDLEVEVFAQERATGRTFKVQLKATESQHGEGRSVRVRMDHLRYWNELDAPVMIVLYVAETRSLYGLWSVSHDPGGGAETQTSTTVHFRDSEMSDSLIAAIPEELEILQALKAGRVPKPLPLRISHPNLAVALRTTLALRQAVTERGLGSEFRLVQSSGPAFVMDLSDSARATVRAPLNAGSITMPLHVDFDDRGQPDAESVLNLLTMVGGVLGKYGDIEAASAVFTSVGFCSLWFTSPLATIISFALSATNRGGAVLALVHDLINDSSGIEYAAEYLSPLQDFSADQADLAQSRLVEQETRALIDRAAEAPPIHYAQIIKLGNLLKSQQRYGEALDMLEQAITRWPYLGTDDPRILVELGALAFRAGRYARSAECYGQALALASQNVRIRAHYSDALLIAGNFARCRDVISDVPAGERTPLERWNALVVEAIIDLTGLDSQEAGEFTAREQQDVESNPHLATSYMRSHNALASRLWQLWISVNEVDLISAAVLCKLMPTEIGHWIIFTSVACQSAPGSAVLRDIVRLAVGQFGDTYLSPMLQVSGPGGTHEDAILYEALVDVGMEIGKVDDRMAPFVPTILPVHD